MCKLNRKGQNTLEYVLLVTAVVAAFLVIQHYVNRAVQGRTRESSDNIGNQFAADDTTTSYTTTRTSTVRETNTAGITSSTLIAPEVTNRQGSENTQTP